MPSSIKAILAWHSPDASTIAVVATSLRWIGVRVHDNCLYRLSFGHRDEYAAATAVGHAEHDNPGECDAAIRSLLERLERYADGEFDDFLDVATPTAGLSPFVAAVRKAVRRIPYGQTRTYGQIAAAVGRPQAARAVGGVMAHNATPLVVPCHRVLASNGSLGGFSAVDGVRMKRRLLDLERQGALVS